MDKESRKKLITSDEVYDKLIAQPDIGDLKGIRLSKHFNAFEFFYSREFEKITISPDTLLRSVQFVLAQNLAKTHLEKLRKLARTIDKHAIILVTSGCRNWEVHEALRIKQKSDPRIVSDHSYIYPYWPLGVGAVDFQVPGFTKDQYQSLLRLYLKRTYFNTFGQVIFYDLHSYQFVHLSNPRSILGLPGRVISRLESAKALRYDGVRFESFKCGGG